MRRVFIIHGWGGYPEEGWFPWLKKELKVGILDDVKIVFIAVSDVEEIIKEEFYREVV